MTAARRRPAIVAAIAAGVLLSAALPAQTVYVAFGDSVTAGVGDSAPEGPNAGYPIRLQSRLGAVVLNRGASGERTPEGLARLPGVLAQGGDVLLLMEGTNDISRKISLETTLFNLDEMARIAESFGMESVHATLIPRLRDAKVDFDNIVNQQLNQALRDLAGRTRRRLVDPFQVFSSQSQLFAKYYWDAPNDPVGNSQPGRLRPARQGLRGRAVRTRHGTAGPRPAAAEPRRRARRRRSPAAHRVLGLRPRHRPVRVRAPGAGRADRGDRDRQLAARRHHLPAARAVEGLVRVRLRTRDLASPANTFDREIVLFTADGTDFLEGDFDFSGDVDQSDLARLVGAFGAVPGGDTWDPAADVNGDEIIDGIDLALLAHNYGKTI